MLDDDPELTHAVIAEREGVSRSRISQILMLRRLPENQQQAILHSTKMQHVTEAQLRNLLRQGRP
ncbi:hypothetical protein JYT15_01000 [Acidimicrobium ferrooxidans]|nr:hypothetical protein [Acidimicrobium ferrooxidans]